MLEQASAGSTYVYEYTIEQSRGPKRHMRSLFAIKSDGAASILVGLTAQAMPDAFQHSAWKFMGRELEAS